MLRFSVIICTYNRSKLLVETIESILNIAKVRNDFELLIIDNNSKDNTKLEVERFLKDPRIIYKCEYNQGLSHARNRGMEEAKGEILVYLDDDIELVDNYFEICDMTFSDNSISISGGKVLPYKVDIPKWLPKKYYYLVSVFDLGDERINVEKLMGANYAIRTTVAKSIGLYNVNLGRKGNQLLGGEEIDYLQRALSQNYKIVYEPFLIVYHKINDKLSYDYINNYSFEVAKSEYFMDRGSSLFKVTLKVIKSIFFLLLSKVIMLKIFEEKKYTWFLININYSKGYLFFLKQRFGLI